MDELIVVVHNRADHSKQSLSIPFSFNDTVMSIEEKISKKVGVPRHLLRVVLCGRALEETTFLRDLLLGPKTSLVAFVGNRSHNVRSHGSNTGNDIPVRSTPDIGSFFVWCKECNDIQRAKLRVYCDKCYSSAVLVSKEPSCWRDVLKSRQIETSCADCNSSSSSYAFFQFKCVSCSQTGAVLSHVRGNWENAECSICLDVHTKYLFDFGCHHLVCRQCFEECLVSALKESRFVFRPTSGFTITCPNPGCERCVTDAHHFRVLGEERYQAYQRMATEKLIVLDDQGVFCPYPDCNSSFFWETENDDGQTSCPDCLRLFCRLCKSVDCICGTDDPSATTIEATTKKCPGCHANTERNEGCTHIHCIVCKMDWCFICEAPWTENCQWNHWFA